ncbi:leucine zipper putative tumor suppressor 3 isoform X3 [Procambarus clarkii]|uniref:leucine zipper putative tumor suppressor 3 isoform X3 n=1 Tax=Procambarus clarkii TaxID=6728 RepID=UPI001E675D13|nr:leucine zipper putative tumor suppressor 3-like isoform X3 [Procambarus clarkii]
MGRRHKAWRAEYSDKASLLAFKETPLLENTEDEELSQHSSAEEKWKEESERRRASLERRLRSWERRKERWERREEFERRERKSVLVGAQVLCFNLRRRKQDSGKVVIRPIAFKPVASTGVHGGVSPQSGCGVNLGASTVGVMVSTPTGTTPPSRPDPRYTSTPTLARGGMHHYGSMGDLKTMSHNSYSLDRRVLATPVSARGYYDHHNNDNNNKYNSLTKLHNSKNTSMNNKNNHNSSNSNSSSNKSPPSYPPPPPRPPSHQSTCSNIEDGLPHHRLPQDNRLSSNYDNSYDNRLTSTYDNGAMYTRVNGYSNSDLPRYDSLKNLSSDSGHSYGHHHHHHHHHHQPVTNGLQQRMGGSVTNLTRISNAQHCGSVQGLDRSGSNIGLDRSASVTGSNLDRSGSVSGSNLGLDRSMSVTGSNLGLDRTICGSVAGSISELTLDEHHQTPSPSDSGVAELEAMLKEKDSEINTLRETMEQNEQVIFKVYEEKEKTWERELKKIRDLYDSRLKGAQQKALKVEQSLTTQTYQLQQERRKLMAELEEARRERDGQQSQVEQLRRELSSLRTQLEETEWSLCQKSGEISLLKTQLKDSQGDQTTRGHELLHLRAQVRQYQTEVERRRAEINSLHDLMGQQRRESGDLRLQLDQAQQQQSQARAHDQDLGLQMDKLKSEVEIMKRESDLQRQQFEEERLRWTEEKERVIRYQKQLHHNYVAMFGRNRQLEEEVARLTGVPLPPTKNLSPPKLPAVYADIRDAPSLPQISSESRC